jgi:hypothetical protein
MSSQCTNCNIQNSSSEYQGSQGEIGIKILPPRKRYNPAVFNATASKASSVLASAVSSVASQTAVGSIDEQIAKQREKMKSSITKLNVDTLLALEKKNSPNRRRRQLFPTPESPIINSLNRKSLYNRKKKGNKKEKRRVSI